MFFADPGVKTSWYMQSKIFFSIDQSLSFHPYPLIHLFAHKKLDLLTRLASPQIKKLWPLGFFSMRPTLHPLIKDLSHWFTHEFRLVKLHPTRTPGGSFLYIIQIPPFSSYLEIFFHNINPNSNDLGYSLDSRDVQYNTRDNKSILIRL